MLAEDKLRDGDLEGALDAVKNAVRGEPSNHKYRTFLFQLLTVTGDWNRALTHLKVVGELDPGALPMVQTYQEALQCETLRAEIFAGKRSPLVFGEPEQWLALLMESLKLMADGKTGEADTFRDQAFESAPTTVGQIKFAQGEEEQEGSFEWIADGDMRLGPVLEAVVNGRYYWIPFHRIHRIQLDKPEDLRDMVWMPAHFTWSNGGQSVGLIPTRYPGSQDHEDASIRLSRRTEWIELDGGAVIGAGQRMLATDGGEFSIMDVRDILLDTLEVGAVPGAAGEGAGEDSGEAGSEGSEAEGGDG